MSVLVVNTVVIHGNFFLLPPVNALASSSPASPNAAATVPPDFYSGMLSPLAQISAHYASSDQQAVPPILNMAMEMENPEYESLEHHLAQLLPPPLIIGQEGDEQQQSDTTIVNPMTATFAGGSFWGVQLAYDREPGVLATCVGLSRLFEENYDSSFL
jgi:hypothetical protein